MAKATILVVDDEPTLRKLMELHLKPHGYRVVLAGNGEEALEVLVAEKPDLAIIDVMMPDMNGFDLTRRIRADSRHAQIPVILLTALSDVKRKVEGFQAGADDFLVKPAELPELLARVEALLRRATITPASKAMEARLILVTSTDSLSLATNVALNLASLSNQYQESIVIELIPSYTNTAYRLGLQPGNTLANLLSLRPENIAKPAIIDALTRHPSSGLRLLASPQDGAAPKPLTSEHVRAMVDGAMRTNALVYVVTHPMLGPALVPLLTSVEAAIMVAHYRPEELASTQVLCHQLRNLGIPPVRMGVLIQDSQWEGSIPDQKQLVSRLRLPLAGVVPELDQYESVARQSGKTLIEMATDPMIQSYMAIVDTITAGSFEWALTPARVQMENEAAAAQAASPPPPPSFSQQAPPMAPPPPAPAPLPRRAQSDTESKPDEKASQRSWFRSSGRE